MSYMLCMDLNNTARVTGVFSSIKAIMNELTELTEIEDYEYIISEVHEGTGVRYVFKVECKGVRAEIVGTICTYLRDTIHLHDFVG